MNDQRMLTFSHEHKILVLSLNRNVCKCMCKDICSFKISPLKIYKRQLKTAFSIPS